MKVRVEGEKIRYKGHVGLTRSDSKDGKVKIRVDAIHFLEWVPLDKVEDERMGLGGGGDQVDNSEPF